MLHKCANPACTSLCRSLSVGKLFLLETDYGEELTYRGSHLRSRRAPCASPHGALLAMRWLLFLTHPDL